MTNESEQFHWFKLIVDPINRSRGELLWDSKIYIIFKSKGYIGDETYYHRVSIVNHRSLAIFLVTEYV